MLLTFLGHIVNTMLVDRITAMHRISLHKLLSKQILQSVPTVILLLIGCNLKILQCNAGSN